MRRDVWRRGRRLATAALLACVVGCAGTSGDPGQGDRSHGPGSRARGWVVGIGAAEASGDCRTTDRLIVCPVAPAGAVAHSASTGAVAWRAGTDRPAGRNSGLAVDGDRAVSAGGRTLRAVDLATGRAAWTKTYPAGRTVGPPAAAGGVVYAATYGATVAEPQTLFAYRASDGTPLWHRASTETSPVALGSRVYAVEPVGRTVSRVVARDGQTGKVVATSDVSHPCPDLISAPGYLVCASSGDAAGDTFPPVVRIDPATLAFRRTLLRPVDKPSGGVISPDGVLVLRTVNAEDPVGGDWTAVDIRTGRTLWRTTGTSDDVVLAGSRAVWISGGRLVSVDPRGGPRATGTAAPRRSPAYREAADGRSPHLTGYGTHLVVQAKVKPALRSVPAP
ncbi:outer membrane protein assembly factor BamB family protein [Streptomyces sp. NBC_00370]|uniref:outer membrane protein assembly factor BamB family protein n=1 Tax=Streptomyces sp. NBC_00370 TaxID=2975728 RepID=UPI002E2522AB